MDVTDHSLSVVRFLTLVSGLIRPVWKHGPRQGHESVLVQVHLQPKTKRREKMEQMSENAAEACSDADVRH